MTRQIQINRVRFGLKTNLKDNCIFCGELVNLDDEGVQYKNGTCAHESCDDGGQFNRANASDFND